MQITTIDSIVSQSLRKKLQEFPPVNSIVKAVHEQGGRALLVGGAVRDLLLGLALKDLDIEVHGLTIEQLEEILRTHGPVSLIGKSFGVLRLHGLDVDWSLPRSDSSGRKPVVAIDPFMGMEKAFRRRDLTINAMGIDLITHELIDPFNGQQDLKEGILRAPDDDLFQEDPLRFYRVMQFIGRFGMQPAESLNALCKKMDLTGISVERIEAEFEKLLLKSKRPSLGIRWLNDIGRLAEILPEVYATIGVKQDPRWHPEGDVFEHTMQAIDAAAAQQHEDQGRKLILMYAALCHDLGKIVTTETLQDGSVISYNHEKAGVPLASSLVKRMTLKKDLVRTVEKLVRYHMQPSQFIKNGAKPSAYKRLARNLAPQVSMLLLADLALADSQGRNPLKGEPLHSIDYTVAEFKKMADMYHVLQEPEPPVLLGRDLLDTIKPGKQMGELLKKAYKIQIDEGITDKEELKKRVLS